MRGNFHTVGFQHLRVFIQARRTDTEIRPRAPCNHHYAAFRSHHQGGVEPLKKFLWKLTIFPTGDDSYTYEISAVTALVGNVNNAVSVVIPRLAATTAN